jgi:4-hydroxy 2-oxovalerate aldolase
MEILDCTFRDGGYQTDWHFRHSLVQAYLSAVETSGIKLVEFGFRSPFDSNTSGAHAFTTERYINSFEIPPSLDLGVMINAKDFISGGKFSGSSLQACFPKHDQSLNFVRIASDFDDLGVAIEIHEKLKSQGLEVHINLMKASEFNPDFNKTEVRRIVDLLNSIELTNLTFADTFGQMTPKDTESLIRAFASNLGAQLGVHMHDNMGLAFANTLAAASSGAEFVDSTIAGIGRGPGNLRTEFLGSVFKAYENELNDLLLLASTEFEPLKSELGWGASSLYYLAAVHSIHPTYIQELTSGKRYVVEDVLRAISTLTNLDSRKFSRDTLERASLKPSSQYSVSTDTSELLSAGWCEGKEVFLIGSGESLDSLGENLDFFLEDLGNAVVVALNLKPRIDPSHVNYFIINDPLKFAIDANEIRHEVTVITPFETESSSKTVFFSGLNSIQNRHEAGFPDQTTLSYALSVLNFGRPKSVSLIGFDGFSDSTERHRLNQQVIDEFRTDHGMEIFFSTPTLYSGMRKSVFSL